MTSDGFVAILRTRSGDENSRGKRTRPSRNCQGSRERNLRFWIRKGHLFFAVGIRSYRILRTHELEQLIQALKLQVARDPALRPNPGNDGFCGVYRAFVDAIHDGNLKMKDGQLLADLDGRHAADALIGTVESGNKLLFIIVRNVQLKTQAQAVGFERALPHAFGAGDGVVRLPGSGAGNLAMKEERKTHVALRPNPLNPGAVCGNFPFV